MVAPTFMFPGVQARLIAVSRGFRNSAAQDRVRAELAAVLRGSIPVAVAVPDAAVNRGEPS